MLSHDRDSASSLEQRDEKIDGEIHGQGRFSGIYIQEAIDAYVVIDFKQF